jgi:hypothetical protein
MKQQPLAGEKPGKPAREKREEKRPPERRPPPATPPKGSVAPNGMRFR